MLIDLGIKLDVESSVMYISTRNGVFEIDFSTPFKYLAIASECFGNRFSLNFSRNFS